MTATSGKTALIIGASRGLGYGLAAVIFLLAKFVTVPRAEDEVA